MVDVFVSELLVDYRSRHAARCGSPLPAVRHSRGNRGELDVDRGDARGRKRGVVALDQGEAAKSDDPCSHLERLIGEDAHSDLGGSVGLVGLPGSDQPELDLRASGLSR